MTKVPRTAVTSLGRTALPPMHNVPVTRRIKSIVLAILAPLLVVAGLYATTAPAAAGGYGGYTDWKTISAGGSQTCAIRTTGQLYCWGTDGTGSSAYPISGYRDWKSVSVGTAHRCAIRGTGYLYCWGSDTYGQIGNGSAGTPSKPARIGSATNWKNVSAGSTHTCGVRGTGILACWGSDVDGKLGNGSSGNTSVPVQVGSITTWKSVSAGGSHSCGIRGSGNLYCWGSDSAGQVGNGGATNTPVQSPTKISSAAWSSVSAGGSHTCAIRGDGLLGCWGSDSNGQLGNGLGGNRSAPMRTTNVSDWRRISAGENHTCGYRGNGALYCWGSNDSRQAVEGSSTTSFQTPQRYDGINDWRVVDAGVRHTCAIRSTGRIYCWGAQRQPSTGTPAGTAYPANVLDLRRWKLTVPYDGSDAGTDADEIKWPPLGSYRNVNYFHSTADNTGIVFRTPVGGAKTGGSVFARTEMRERTRWDGNSQTNCNWTNKSGTHPLRITQKATHLPSKLPNIVLGQIHDPRDEVAMVRVNGSSIIAEASYPEAGSPDGHKYPKTLKTGYRLGTTFTIRITASPSGVVVIYNEGKSDARTASFAGRVAKNAYDDDNAPSGVVPDGWYFKAGHYLQTNTAKGDAPSDFGEAILYKLSISHSNGVCG